MDETNDAAKNGNGDHVDASGGEEIFYIFGRLEPYKGLGSL